MTSNEQGLLKTAAWKWITRLLLIAISVTMLFPLLWNLYSSFKTNTRGRVYAALPSGMG